MNKKVLWITQTALFLALLIVCQAVTRAMSQLVTGSCVNAVLALATLATGCAGGLILAAVSPFLAFVLGIGPQLFPIVPAIAAGNLLYVAAIGTLERRIKNGAPKALLLLFVPAVLKAAALYLLIVRLLCHILPLQDKQIQLFTAMFSWPQLITALIGSALALLIAPVIRRAKRAA